MTKKNSKMSKQKKINNTEKKINSILYKNEIAWQIYEELIPSDNKIDEALKIYNDILKEKPTYLPSLLGIGDIYYDQKNFEKALEYYSEFSKISKEINNEKKNIYFQNQIRIILFKIGKIYENINDYNRANKIFKNLAKKKKIGKFENDPIDLAIDRLKAHIQLNEIGLKIG